MIVAAVAAVTRRTDEVVATAAVHTAESTSAAPVVQFPELGWGSKNK